MYDMVFITHLPAFYKLNLYNELAKSSKILVIFISTASEIRDADFVKGEMRFDAKFINNDGFEKRRKLSSLFSLLIFLSTVKYKRLIVGGWDLIEFWGAAFISSRNKNAVVIESTRFESSVSGIRGLIKKSFLRRMSAAFCSGEPHRELIESLDFSGKVITTHGVGLSNHAKNCGIKRSFSGRFLYVGRLANEKNLGFLLDFFSNNSDLHLTVVGDGPLRDVLTHRGSTNVVFKGYVKNLELAEIYREHDVFILPSKSEPWGLVIEEALAYGLPVICSDRVGCSKDLVEKYGAGIVFSSNDLASLALAVSKMRESYILFYRNVSSIDFDAIEQQQVESYLQ